MPDSLLQVEDVGRTYHGGARPVPALRGVSLEVDDGEFLALTGPSGSGKTTLLNILGLLDRPDTGEYLFRGCATSALPERRRAVLRGSSIGFVFQAFNLLADRTALENVELGLRYRRMSASRRRDEAAAALTKVGLEDRLRHLPRELSGGEQQRVAIARAIVGGRTLLLCDEPTGNLDSASAHQVLGVLTGLNDEGATVVLVTHNDEMARYATRVLALRDGYLETT